MTEWRVLFARPRTTIIICCTTGTPSFLSKYVARFTKKISAHSHHAKFFLFCKKSLSTRNHFQCKGFFLPAKIFASATKLQRCRQLDWEAYIFGRSIKSIVPREIPFNWSSYFVIDRSVLVRCRMTLSPLSKVYEKGLGKLRFQTMILQIDGRVDGCWAAEFRSPWSIKAKHRTQLYQKSPEQFEWA